MRVLVIGGGGREHAMVLSLSRSNLVTELICAPGNSGTSVIAENVDLDLNDLDGLTAFAKQREVDFTVVGPEAPLCAGIVDKFQAAGLKIFGPTAAAARIEGDKAYAKKLMKAANVPTAEASIFRHYEAAKEYVATRDSGVVVKASGLAAGKGVAVCKNQAEAIEALDMIMLNKSFGSAGNVVIIEEKMKGPELSVFAMIDGTNILILETAQDHKAVGDGDTGPNTGGMGAYSPAPIATREVMSVVEREVLVPIVDALKHDDAPYRGLLYVGLMLTHGGPKVLEFNCRFGDPEAQVLLARLSSDFMELLLAVADGKLDQVDVRWDQRPAVCVVMASGGYPGKYQKGKVIAGIDRAVSLDDVRVYHAGTKRLDEYTVTNGGRVLGVTALGQDLSAAKRRAYEAVELIEFEDAIWRTDIADKGIEASVSATKV